MTENIKNILCTIEEAKEELKNGRTIIIVDEEDREHEGDLVFPAQFSTKEKLNFMMKEGRGLICLTLTEEKRKALQLPLMKEKNDANFSTNFTMSVEAKEGVTTGVSAADKQKTILDLTSPKATIESYVSPGHIFPLVSQEGGVLKRLGHTESSTDLMLLSGLTPMAVICEIVNDDGTMAKNKDLIKFAKKHNIKIIHTKQIQKEVLKQGRNILKIHAKAKLPTEFGTFNIYAFEENNKLIDEVIIAKETYNKDKSVLTRIHSECLTGDVFHSLKCDCKNQLHEALKEIEEKGGVIAYSRTEGRGIGIANKVAAYKLQEEGFDTIEANLELGLEVDSRDYIKEIQMLKLLKVKNITLMTNNPKKIEALKGVGFDTIEGKESITEKNKYNEGYLETKKVKMKHKLK